MRNKIDKIYFGVLVGLVLPILAFVFYWYWKYSGTFGEYLNYIMGSPTNRNSPLVFAMVPNLILFYFSNFQLKFNNFTVGLVGVTLAYTIPIVFSLLG